MSQVGEVGLRAPANRVSRSAFWYWTLREGVLSAAVVAAAFAVGYGVETDSAALDRLLRVVPVLLLVAAVATVAAVPTWRWRVHRWEVTDTAVYTLEGALSRDWRIVPLARVQTVDIEQNPVERLFGIARLVVRTASYAGSTEVAGLDAELARELAAQLTRRLRRHEDDGT